MLLVVLVVGLFGGASLAGYSYYRGRTGDILHPNARFVAQGPQKPHPRGRDHFAWPLYGYTKDHTRYFPNGPRPPFRRRWVIGGRALLEFPPVISRDTLYQLNDSAELLAIAKRTGRVLWHRRLGALSASTPAASGDTVYVTILERRRGLKKGRVVALRQRDGKIRWSRDLPSRSESSPLLDRGRLYFGSESGTVYALRARSGRVLWTYHDGGAVKASPTLAGGKLFFGDYNGSVQAISEATGRRIWSTSTSGGLFGSGTFYSTPAVRYGRVFVGSTDGHVYAFDSVTGKLDWAKQTGSYVYASPAVTETPGLGPTIYLGSYNGTFYALDAHTGRVRWRYHAGGRISGSATIVAHTVYFADLAQHMSIGLDIRSGRRVFRIHAGSFDPVISDGKWLFLSGYTGLYALVPRPRGRGGPARHRGPRRRGARASAGARPKRSPLEGPLQPPAFPPAPGRYTPVARRRSVRGSTAPRVRGRHPAARAGGSPGPGRGRRGSRRARGPAPRFVAPLPGVPGPRLGPLAVWPDT